MTHLPAQFSTGAAAIILLAGGAACFAQTEQLLRGELAAEINRYGVLVGAPAGPLKTFDGPIMSLAEAAGPVREWAGIQFMEGEQVVRAVAPGLEADWLGRDAVEPVSLRREGEVVVADTRYRRLFISSRFSFDPDAPHLICTVTFTNEGAEPLRGLFYSREAVEADPGAGWTFPTDWAHEVPAGPAELCRRLWMLDDIAPGDSQSVTFSYTTPGEAAGASDVPLSLWTSAAFPSGLIFGRTNGISWGDYDADGWPDVFACMGGELWRNLQGAGWEKVDDLDRLLPATARRYGSSFGDYDNSGLPAIGTEPRDGFGGDECLHLLRQDAPLVFIDVARDPAIVDNQPCNAHSETICWGDVDCDNDLDMALPVYPAWAFGNHGNYFLTNLGPTGPGGHYRFTENTAEAGFTNPPGSARPEGAQFCDIDFDGDMDWYCNGTLYQNNSPVGSPRFNAMTPGASGVGFSTSLEEGIVFLDYDLDGDYDLICIYTGPGIKLWENRGDGTYFERAGVIDSPLIGLDLGISCADWDNDGDIDFTTRSVFRQNMLMETGDARYTVASTPTIPAAHRTSATPAWADWDRDGDLDCALGNWLEQGRFYVNNLYDQGTTSEQNRSLRVRPMTDDDTIARGLETQYAANVHIRLGGAEPDGHRRMNFVSSSAGYLNQNEYPVHFALPADPFPGDPTRDLLFDLVVDFPSLPSEGFLRVDRHVNPALGAIHLADLTDREIVVFRSGRVEIDGQTFGPTAENPLLTTAGGGLVSATPTQAMLRPQSLGSARPVSLDVDTTGAAGPLRIAEIIVDGQLAPPSACLGADPANLALWDVTDAGPAQLVTSLAAETRARNDRSWIPANLLLAPDRQYRLIANVTAARQTSISGPIAHDGLTVLGGAVGFAADFCEAPTQATLPTDPMRLYLSMRFRPADAGCRADVNGDGVLDFFDFLEFQDLFAAGDPRADFTGDGVLDFFDFLAFQDEFAAGCP
jgi:hypothetical protein